MRRYFIKTVLGIVTIMILGVLSLVYWVIEPAFDEFSPQEYQEETALEHTRLSHILTSKIFSDWPAQVDNYKSHFELTTRLIPRSELPVAATSFKTLSGASGYFYEDEDDSFFVYYPSIHFDWLIEYSEGDSEFAHQQSIEQAVLLLIVGPLAIILLSMMAGIIYLVYNFSQPMRVLEAAMDNFSSDTRVRLEPKQVKAIPKVALAFNTMAEQLDQLLAEQQVMIAAIPHELRTPIARIRFALDMLRGKEGQRLKEGLEDIDCYVDELHQVAEDIIQLSRLQHTSIPTQRLDLIPLVRLKTQGLLNNPKFQLSVPQEPVQVIGHSGLLRQVIDNLLNNALQHYQAHLQVRLFTYKDYAYLEVENDGAHLTQQDLSQLFQAFFRADTSRSRNTGGAGIGLTLVAQIIDKHQASISAQLISPDVLAIKVRLKLDKQ